MFLSEEVNDLFKTVEIESKPYQRTTTHTQKIITVP